LDQLARGREDEFINARDPARWMEPSSPFTGIIAGMLALTALLIVRKTGGLSSNFVALLYLPVVLSVLACRFYCTVCIGMAIAVLSPYVMHPYYPAITGSDVIRGFIMVSVAVVGAVYARETKRERNGIRRLVREKDVLLSASQIVSAAARLEDGVASVLSLLPDLINKADCAAIYFLDEGQRVLEQYDASGTRKGDIQIRRLSLAECGMRGQSFPMPPISVFAEEGPSHHALYRLNPNAGSALSIALNASSPARPPIGMLYVSSVEPHAFAKSHERLLQEYAERIAPPLHKLRVQEGLTGLAYTDGLTGLYNFRYFSQQMEEEIRRAERYGRPVSLILLDLDDFKAVNDRHGHPVGDRLLASLAAIIRAHIRETDYPARYGGEEFAVICPETRIGEACALGERIRAAVEQGRFGEEGTANLRATVSVGIATSPDDGTSVTELVVAADGALYEAKRSGKNQVVSRREFRVSA
jgi:diguanylate cyclase (GGDEF)-like protein